MNSASGSLIGGSDNLSPESSSATIASASRIWDGAIPNRIATAEPKVNQVAARDGKDSGGFIKTNSQYDKRADRAPHGSFVSQGLHRIEPCGATGRPDAEEDPHRHRHHHTRDCCP